VAAAERDRAEVLPGVRRERVAPPLRCDG